MILFGHILKKTQANRCMIDNTRTILLKNRPTGELSADNFAFSEIALPEPAVTAVDDANVGAGTGADADVYTDAEAV